MIKISFKINDQIIDLEFPRKLKISTVKTELCERYHLPPHILFKVPTKQQVLDENARFSDYVLAQGELIELTITK